MSWLPEQVEGASPLDRVFGLRPDLYEPFRAFYATFWTHDLLDPIVLELCRLRVAQLLRCESEQWVRYEPALRAGLTEEQVARLAQWPTTPMFSPAQRAALGFAEQFVIDVEGIDAQLRDAVVDHFTVAGLVALCEALALFDGFCRFRTMLGVDGDSRSEVIVVPGPTPREGLR
ncbi:MAG TPA: carboxymuconolactone decarboxylase family protein [Acidimicrobiia bacterium]